MLKIGATYKFKHPTCRDERNKRFIITKIYNNGLFYYSSDNPNNRFASLKTFSMNLIEAEEKDNDRQ